MKFVSFFIVSACFINLAAQDNYLLVTKVKDKKHLPSIHSKFSKLELKMLYSYNDKSKFYTIYSGPYQTIASARVAQRRLKPYFKHTRISSRKTLNKRAKRESQKKPQTQERQTKVEITSKKKSGFYVGLAAGYASAPSSHIISSGSVLIDEPKNEGLTLSASAGYNFKSGFSLGLGYMNFDANDIEFDNLYTELNYRFEAYNSFVPYFGLLAGYSSLTWSVSPIPSPQAVSNNDSDSPFGGTQAGMLYRVVDGVSLLGVYQCLFMEHTTNVNTSTQTSQNLSQLQHNTLHSLQIGINYNF
ncbi:MAG: outer membrane beta-barrel protein [Campylobacterota bacterium]|nr:outer membrane beta-barrel protein [Campylobacterota bacterium]